MVDSGGCCWGKFLAFWSQWGGGGGGRATPLNHPHPLPQMMGLRCVKTFGRIKQYCKSSQWHVVQTQNSFSRHRLPVPYSMPYLSHLNDDLTTSVVDIIHVRLTFATGTRPLYNTIGPTQLPNNDVYHETRNTPAFYRLSNKGGKFIYLFKFSFLVRILI